ncbi:hypothetical protein ACFV1U_26195 [Streptomyces microflavus]|uniref:hypothetical protein n=2 Tax=Streptomyces microflavus TaxID=1919 RepID=UPI0036B406A2
MVALMFVHGTGVRRPSYDKTLEVLEKGIGRLLPGTPVHECYWGRVHETEAAEDTTPEDIDHMGDLPLPEEDEDAVKWGVYYEDPLAALRQLTEAGASHSGGFVLGDRSGPELERRARALAADPPDELARLLDWADLRERFPLVVADVLASPDCRSALVSGESDRDLPVALAVAFVARMLGDAQRAGLPLVWSTAERDAAVTLISGEVGGERGSEQRGVGLLALGVHGWAAHRFGVMRAVEKRRDKWLDASALQTGDILRYLVRGEGMRNAILEDVERVARTEGPVVLLAHSLGGIASVDLLVAEALPGVCHLVTMGSQAGYLYRNGALPSLEAGKPLPDHFPRWTNVVDPRDLLAFDAEPLFPGRVTDRLVASGEPFLASHSAYFASEEVHKLLAATLREHM